MNTILKNEEFLLKLEERIIDKLADKIVDKVVTDQEFSAYLQEETEVSTSSKNKKDVIYNPLGHTDFKEFLEQISKPDVDDVIAGLRSVGPTDEIPGSVSKFAPKSYSEFVEKKKASNPTSDNISDLGVPKPYSDLDDYSRKVEPAMEKFEKSIVTLIEQGRLSDVNNLNEFYDKVDRILTKMRTFNSASFHPGAAASATERDKIHAHLDDARAFSYFSSQSEVMAETLFLNKIKNGEFKLTKEIDGYTTSYHILFDSGEAIIEDYNNTQTGRRELAIKNFILLGKTISGFNLSANKIKEVCEILEEVNPEYTKDIGKIKNLSGDIESKRHKIKDKKEELLKQEVRFMSPEFLQEFL